MVKPMLEHAKDVAKRNISNMKNPVKAIRAKCIDCCGAEDYIKRIKECEILECALYPFRMGTNPFRTKKALTEEQKEAAKERMRNARELNKLKQQKGV